MLCLVLYLAIYSSSAPSNQTSLVMLPSCVAGLVGKMDSFSPVSTEGLICQVRKISEEAIVSQTSGRLKSFPANGSTWEYCAAAKAAEIHTQATPKTEVPYRRSTLLMVFQVSPMDKCSMSAKMAGDA